MSFRIQSGQPGFDLTAGRSLIGSTATSPRYSEPRRARQLVGDLPIRQERVEALRAQIEAGTYLVDPHALAEAMFQNLFRC